MPRSRGGSSEMLPSSTPAPATQSPRLRVPLHLKSTAASEANSLLHGRSPRPEVKKRASAAAAFARAADLETKLAQAMEELKSLQNQLAKRDAEQDLEAAKTHISATSPPPPATQEIPDTPPPLPSSEPPATDVFEVVPPAVTPTEPEQESDGDKPPPAKAAAEEAAVEIEPPELAEMVELRATLAEKERELELCVAENEGLKKRAAEAEEEATAAKVREVEVGKKLVCAEEEVAERRAAAEKLRAEVGAAEMETMAVEAEMGRVKAQAEQWRKAAEAAAAVLADEGEGGGSRVAKRCGSMAKSREGFGSVWSPLINREADEECGAGGGGGRKKGVGIMMFGDLWKKKGQQHK